MIIIDICFFMCMVKHDHIVDQTGLIHKLIVQYLQLRDRDCSCYSGWSSTCLWTSSCSGTHGSQTIAWFALLPGLHCCLVYTVAVSHVGSLTGVALVAVLGPVPVCEHLAVRHVGGRTGSAHVAVVNPVPACEHHLALRHVIGWTGAACVAVVGPVPVCEHHLAVRHVGGRTGSAHVAAVGTVPVCEHQLALMREACLWLLLHSCPRPRSWFLCDCQMLM